jgi:hypothetical protein
MSLKLEGRLGRVKNGKGFFGAPSMDIWETYAPAGLGLGFLAALIFLLGRTATGVAHGYRDSAVPRFKHYTQLFQAPRRNGLSTKYQVSP